MFCAGCGDEIYVKRYRLKQGKGIFCQKCWHKISLPPMVLVGGGRAPWRMRCQKCGARDASGLYPCEDGLQCFTCSKVLYTAPRKEMIYVR